MPCILGSLLIRIRTSGQMVSVGIYVTSNRNITDSIERFYVSRQWHSMIKIVIKPTSSISEELKVLVFWNFRAEEESRSWVQTIDVGRAERSSNWPQSVEMRAGGLLLTSWAEVKSLAIAFFAELPGLTVLDPLTLVQECIRMPGETFFSPAPCRELSVLGQDVRV